MRARTLFHSKSRRPVAGAHAAARVAGSAVTSLVWSVAPGPFGPTYLYANAEELIKAAVRRSVNHFTLCKVNFGGQLKSTSPKRIVRGTPKLKGLSTYIP